MKRLKLVKAWSHDEEEFVVDEILEISETLADDLIEKGIAVLDGKVTKAKAPEDPKPDPEDKPVTLDSIKAMVAELIGAENKGVKVKRPKVVVGKNLANDDPAFGFKSRRDFFWDVYNAEMKSGPIPERLAPLVLKAVGGDEQSVAADQYGGFLLPETFMPELLKIAPEGDVLAGRTQPIPMQTPTVHMNARVDKNHTESVSGGLTFSRREEMGTKDPTRMKFEKITLEAHMLFGSAIATEELLQDSPLSFTQILASGFSDQFLYHIMDERIDGSGVGQYLGVLNSPALLTIDAETDQVAETLVYENIIKMRAQCWKYGDAIWLANLDTLPQLMLLNQSVGIGGIPIWMPGGFGGATQDHPDTLLGRPIFFSEQPKTLGTTGDLILGNWSQYLEGTYAPMASAESMHVRFFAHERAFKFFTRNDARPWWTSTLTPKESAKELSPFVVLATRS